LFRKKEAIAAIAIIIILNITTIYSVIKNQNNSLLNTKNYVFDLTNSIRDIKYNADRFIAVADIINVPTYIFIIMFFFLGSYVGVKDNIPEIKFMSLTSILVFIFLAGFTAVQPTWTELIICPAIIICAKAVDKLNNRVITTTLIILLFYSGYYSYNTAKLLNRGIEGYPLVGNKQTKLQNMLYSQFFTVFYSSSLINPNFKTEWFFLEINEKNPELVITDIPKLCFSELKAEFDTGVRFSCYLNKSEFQNGGFYYVTLCPILENNYKNEEIEIFTLLVFTAKDGIKWWTGRLGEVGYTMLDIKKANLTSDDKIIFDGICGFLKNNPSAFFASREVKTNQTVGCGYTGDYYVLTFKKSINTNQGELKEFLLKPCNQTTY